MFGAPQPLVGFGTVMAQDLALIRHFEDRGDQTLAHEDAELVQHRPLHFGIAELERPHALFGQHDTGPRDRRRAPRAIPGSLAMCDELLDRIPDDLRHRNDAHRAGAQELRLHPDAPPHLVVHLPDGKATAPAHKPQRDELPRTGLQDRFRMFFHGLAARSLRFQNNRNGPISERKLRAGRRNTLSRYRGGDNPASARHIDHRLHTIKGARSDHAPGSHARKP